MSSLEIGGDKSRWANIYGVDSSQVRPVAGAVVDQRQLIDQKDNGPNSNYVQCFYSDTNNYILCDKQFGCCDTGCCNNDSDWMGGIYVLAAFVIITVVVGFVTAIVCYQRSKNKARKEQEAYDHQYARSQYTVYPYHYPVQPNVPSRPGNFATLY